MTPGPAKLRVLCMHGFAQDGTVFRGKCGALRKSLKASCEFYFLDAPHDVKGAFQNDQDALKGCDGTDQARNLAWFTSRENTLCGATKSSDQGWTRPAMSKTYDGFDLTVEKIRSAIESDGPFEGVIGFSQGSTAAVAALASIEELRASAKFVLLIAGFGASRCVNGRANRGRVALSLCHRFTSTERETN